MSTPTTKTTIKTIAATKTAKTKTVKAKGRVTAPTTTRVVIARPGQPAEVAVLANEGLFDKLRALVEGHVEVISMGKHAVLVNEEGLLRGLAPNRIVGGYPLVGTIVVSGSSHGRLASLTEEDATRVVGLLG